MKRLVRVVGIDDGSFKPRSGGKALVVGVVSRLDNRVEGILSTYVTVDALDATDSITEMISKSKFFEQIEFVFLDGVNVAGFNIIDLRQLHNALKIPVAAVFRKQPDFEKIYSALENFSDSSNRKELIRKAGEIHAADGVFFQCFGASPEETERILRKSSHHSNLPEVLRLAHLIASGVSRGESTRP